MHRKPVRTQTFRMRISPEVRLLLEMAAKADGRDMSGEVEWLIRQRHEKLDAMAAERKAAAERRGRRGAVALEED